MVQLGDESVNEGEVVMEMKETIPDSNAIESTDESDPIRELAGDREAGDSVRDETVPSEDVANGHVSECDVEHPIRRGSGNCVGLQEVRIGETEAVTIESDQSVAREETPTTHQGQLAIEAIMNDLDFWQIWIVLAPQFQILSKIGAKVDLDLPRPAGRFNFSSERAGAKRWIFLGELSVQSMTKSTMFLPMSFVVRPKNRT
jgi:hypothetical protein